MSTVSAMPPRVFQPARLRLARMLRGLRQNALAGEVEVTAAAISQYESGAAVPSAETLERLAVRLGCSPEFFGRPWRPVTVGEPFFRSRRNTPQHERDRAEAFASVLAEIAALLEQHVEFPLSRFDARLPLDDDTPLDHVERAAGELRAAWRIPSGPVPNVVRLLETRGAIVAAVGAWDPRMDAFSVRTHGRPVVVLCSDAGNAARRRFDAAHELGHLLMHDRPLEANSKQEQQAHRFAASLLMPAEEILPWLPRRSNDLELLEDGSRTWGVSMQALLFRARTLCTLSEDAYRRAMQRMSARGWRTREPVEFGPAEAPELLRRAAAMLPAAGTSLSRIAAEFGVPTARLARMLSVPEEQEEAHTGQVVELRAS
jgi:Zn-dependent peptidase ImmA (M78 family)/DNA-binding XRE family transcriptional regulator